VRTTRLETADGRVVCERLELADTFWTRFRGLMGRRSLSPGDGMLFRPGGSVHMFFMRFPLDVVFCDRELRVLAVRPRLQPWRTAGTRGAKVTIELAAGEAATRGVEPGTVLRLVP
jgi:uncharacterized membrane protein (UPF0127 family)